MSLWGGRFVEEPDELLWAYTVERSDRRLLLDDLAGSRAHVAMLAHVGLLDRQESESIAAGLETLLVEARENKFVFLPADEDVHSAVERRLGELIGSVAGKLHSGRSRNDQIALDLRLYMRRSAAARMDQMAAFALALADVAEANGHHVVATYTHLQPGQAVVLGHHLMAYAWMVLRDRARFSDLIERLAVSPLGAGAGGGTSLMIDPSTTASQLGFESVFDNSMDAVASRDLESEYVFVAAQSMVHLSRLAEDMLIWATEEFGWVTYLDRHTTGSSAMPQKKNADIAELARGRAATVVGDVAAILALQKGLPMTYNRDLQEDKRLLFHSDDTLRSTLQALRAMVLGARFHPPAPSKGIGALDLAEVLTARGVPFRQAHHAVGALVIALAEDGRTLDEVTVADLQAVHPVFEPGDEAVLDPAASVARRLSHGGGSAESLTNQVEKLRSLLL